jgi:hypothetical protein
MYSSIASPTSVFSPFKIADVGFYPEINYYTMVALNEYNWA